MSVFYFNNFVFLRVRIMMGTIINCAIIPGTASANALVKKIDKVKVFPAIPYKNIEEIPHIILPISIETGREIKIA